MYKLKQIEVALRLLDQYDGQLIKAIYFLPIKGKYVSPMLVNRL